jgi:hypothetical protein
MPTVSVSLLLPGITADFVAVEFLFDSGATTSCVHPQDARCLLGIPDSMLSSSLLWPGISASHGVGGTNMSYVHPAIYGFVHEDGRFQTMHDDVHVARPTTSNGTLPSLLGWDVLRRFRIELDDIEGRVTLR